MMVKDYGAFGRLSRKPADFYRVPDRAPDPKDL